MPMIKKNNHLTHLTYDKTVSVSNLDKNHGCMAWITVSPNLSACFFIFSSSFFLASSSSLMYFSIAFAADALVLKKKSAAAAVNAKCFFCSAHS